MERMIVPAAGRAKLGVDASEGLVAMFSLYQQFATDRYERRLAEEIGLLRVELHDGLAAIRLEMERTRTDVLRWSVVLWLGQFAASSAVLSYMLR